MKKIVLNFALIATGILASTLNSQAQKGFQLGIEGTPQMSWLLNNDDMNNSKFTYNNSTFNGNFGISTFYGFNKNIGIGLNGLYSMQGQRYTLNNADFYKKVEYVKIPVMFVYRYEFNTMVCFLGKIGPSFDILTNAHLTDKNGNDIVSDQKPAYQDFVITGMINAGFGFKLSDYLMLDASLRLDYSFTDAEKDTYKNVINNPTNINGLDHGGSRTAMTNNATGGITIGLRYLFGEE